MDCNETRQLIEAHLDGELDLARHVAIEAHVRTCATCAQLLADGERRRTALREGLPRYSAPTALADRIRAALPPTVDRTTSNPVAPRSTRLASFWQLGGLAAGFAVALLAGFAWGTQRAKSNGIFDEAFVDHVRSLQIDHLTDVVSTDQHTVKPWFAGKLDFSPPVVDLAESGFPLAGGRLEHIAGRPAAALVFRRRQHAINLFIWPVGETAFPNRRAQHSGFHAESWTADGLNFLAVSEIPADELDRFATAFREHAR